MKTNIKFGRWEMCALILNAINAQVFLNFPASTCKIAGNASWILSLYIFIISLIIFFIIERLYSSFEGKSILEISEFIGGNLVRVIVGLSFIAQIIFIAPLTLREFSENMKIIAFTRSPMSFILLFFAFGMVISSFVGIEAITRLNSIFVPIIIIGFITIILLVSNSFNFSNIFPVLGNGPYNIFVRGIPAISSFSAFISLYIYAPYIRTHANFKWVGYVSIALSGVFFILASLVYILVFNYPTALEYTLPFYELTRIIHYGTFIQRVESLFLIIWVISALSYLSSAFFALLFLFKETFKLKHYKPLIFPMIIIFFTITLLPNSLTAATTLESKYARIYAFLTAFVLTIIILSIANILKKISKKGEITS